MRQVSVLAGLATALAGGIAVADHGGLDTPAALQLGVAATLVGCAARHRVRLRLCMCLLIAFSIGAHRLAGRLESARSERPTERSERIVEGRVEAVRRSAGGFRLDLGEVRSVDAHGPLPGRLRVFGARTPEGVAAFELAPRGALVRTALVVRPSRDTSNPGVRSRSRDLARAGIGGVARLQHPALHVRMLYETGFAPAAAALSGVDTLRLSVSAKLARAGPGSELLRALALGDRSGIGPGTRDAFRALGLSHLLAVSGLHLALIGALGFALSRGVLGRVAGFAARWDTRSAALGVALVAATAYALLAGWGVPVRRAWVLLLGVGVSVWRGRRARSTEPIAAAAVLVLLADPLALFDPGAQLSFAAATALTRAARVEPATTDDGESWFARGRSRLDAALRASATAVAATTPFAAWHFGSLAPIGIVTNLVAIPWTAFVLLPSSLGAAMASAFGWEGPASLAARIASLTLESVDGATDAVGGFPAGVSPGRLAFVVSLGLAVAAVSVRSTLGRLALAVAVNAVLAAAPGPQLGSPRWVAFDVGQGSASLVHGRSTVVLVDAGGAGPNGDWGQRAVVPGMRSLGVRHIDVAAISHADLDHRGGMESVLESFPIGEVWVPYGAFADPAFEGVLRLAEQRGVPVVESGAGSRAEFDDGLQLLGLWPPKPGEGEPAPRTRNDGSLVVRIEVGGRRLLFPGDIEAAAERRLLEQPDLLQADAIAVAHHGSRTSSSAAFLSAVGAEFGVVSAPCEGRFGMPHGETRDRLKRAQMTMWWTGRDGAVIVDLAATAFVWPHRDRPYRCP
jgi:competence protein ComEC